MTMLIVLPTYNRSHLIKNVINDILKQTDKNWKMIIINDGSSDIKKYREIMKKIDDERIEYIENDMNIKLPASLNVGVKYFLKNNYEYMTWISDDNVYYSNFIEELVKNLELGNDFVYTKFDYVRPHKSNKIFSTKRIYKSYKDLLKLFSGLGSVGWSRNSIEKIGFFNEELFLVEDFDYYLRTMIKTDNIKYVNVSTMKIILSTSNLTSQYKPKIKKIKNTIDKIYKQILFHEYDEIKFIDENIFEIKDKIFYCDQYYKKITLSIIDNL